MNSVPSVVVVGSINMDLVARMARLPKRGETVSGDSFATIPGGKGANQAVAVARLRARVQMIGRVGSDEFGRSLRAALLTEGVDTRHVLDTADYSTGVAMISVDVSGANSIAVIPGANGQLSRDDVYALLSVISSAAALIVQFETPIRTVWCATEIARDAGVLTVLDPAPVPAEKLPHELFAVDILSPNQTEAEALTGIRVNDWNSAESAAHRLQKLGARDVVLKLGELGALVMSRDGAIDRVKAQPARIVDTTAAGDAFTAALTVARCEGRSLVESARYGCLAGTLACTQFGAQPSMPTRDQVDHWYDELS